MTQVLYGALGGANTTSDLYSIDPVTGTATSIGPIGDAISGLAFDPTDGTLYGATSNNSAANPRCLITINPLTGARIAVIGQFSAASTHLFSDIDFDSSGQLYGQATWQPPGGTLPRQLCAIDKTDASIVVLSSSESLSNNAFAILRSTGKGYEPVSFLWESDLASNGATTNLGALGGSGSFSAAAGSIDDSDLLWTVSNDGSLRTVDLTTRVVTVGASTTPLMDGIAWSLPVVVSFTNPIAKFDCAAGSNYAVVTAPTAGDHVVATADVRLTTATLAAIHGSFGSSANFVFLGGSTVAGDGPFADDEDLGPPFRWWAAQSGVAPPNDIATADEWHTIVVDATFVSATNWDVIIKVDGVTEFTDLGVDFGVDDTTPLKLAIGGLFPCGVADEIYYVRDVSLVVDGVTEFSDDFGSGDFSGWTTTGIPEVIEDPFVSAGGTPVPQAASHPPTIWRWVICDLDGNPISIITGLAQNQEMLFLLNRPTLLTFDVPSDEPLINIQHTDGEPYLSCGNRMIKGYRKVANGPVETPGGWEIAYSGRVWILQDSGDGDSVRTSVTCYDWYNDLSRRTCRDFLGNRFQDQSQFSFSSVAADQIIKQLIDNTNSYAPTRLTTSSFTTCASQSVSYDLAYIVPSITDLTNTGLVDLIPEYLDSIIGVHMQIGAAPRRGTDKSASIIFGYDAPPRISSGFDRTLTIENLANDITMYGNKRTSKSTGTSAGSITKYDTFELVDAEAEISSTSLLDDLVTEMVALRANPNETIGVIPAPHISPLFLTDFDIGDSVTINAATTPFPVTRQAVIGVQRIYGVRLVIDIDAGERITELVVSAQAE